MRSRRAHMWWIVEGDIVLGGIVLGGIVLRTVANDWVRRVGHIGYGIRPSGRGRGVATWALGEVAGRARHDGMERVLLVCRAENLASRRTIERCGGVLDEVVEDERGLARRYWISL